MKRNNIKKSLEYVSLSLVLSFFFLHNIYLVCTGIILSLYEINKFSINNCISFQRKDEINKRNKLIIQEERNGNKDRQSNKKESALRLAERIEELGFIPSMENIDDTNAA